MTRITILPHCIQTISSQRCSAGLRQVEIGGIDVERWPENRNLSEVSDTRENTLQKKLQNIGFV
jgi:hypothetical protein